MVSPGTGINAARPLIQDVLEVVSGLLDLPCMIYDASLKVVAATGHYSSGPGQSILALSVFDRVIQTKQSFFAAQLPQEPGADAGDQGPRSGESSYAVYPLVVSDEVVGGLLIGGFGAAEAARLISGQAILPALVRRIERVVSTSIDHFKLNVKLTEAREQIRGVVQAIGEGIMAVDKDGTVICCNRAGADILDVKVDDFVGQPLSRFSPKAPILGILSTGFGYVNREVVVQTTHGARRVLATGSPIMSAGGLVGAVALMKTAEDIRRLAYDVSESQPDYSIDRILGASPQIESAKRLALRAAATTSPVLLRGESGTGKELFARAIHRHSGRVLGPFIAVNCAAIPDQLLESELFGYEEGAFTGAKRGGKPGKFELADGGTLFLDEVGDCSLNLQAKLLRVLDNCEVTRLGGTNEIRVNVRVIAASNKDLDAKTRSREFREELYFRLSVIPIEIPPLREREGDIALLFHHLLLRYAAESGKKVPSVSNGVMSRLMNHDWPGNVRELENVVQFLLSFDEGGAINLADLPPRLTQVPPGGPAAPGALGQQFVTTREWERQAIEEGLRLCGETPKAKDVLAAKLGISRSTLYRKIKQYCL